MNGWQINHGLCASEARLTTNQVLTGVGLIRALDVDPQHLLRPAFGPLASLPVAVILDDAGLSLDMCRLKGHTCKVVIRLIILVVSGPAVVGPFLSFVRPTGRLQQTLIWEGSQPTDPGQSELAEVARR